MGAAREAGLDTLLPLNPLALPAAFFEPDAIHLNPKGAALFTAALENDLPRKIDILETAAAPN